MKTFLPRRFAAAVFVLLTVLGISARGQSLEPAQKIFDSMIEALGGKAYLDVKEIQVSGRFFQFQHGSLSASDLYTDYIKFPDMERTEFGKERQKTVRIN